MVSGTIRDARMPCVENSYEFVSIPGFDVPRRLVFHVVFD
jgi:hypothetical protein